MFHRWMQQDAHRPLVLYRCKQNEAQKTLERHRVLLAP